MRVYETTFIINPQVDDATIDQQVAAVSEIITKSGGKILHEQRVGTRRLAYAINGIAQGYYTSLYHEAPTEALNSLNRHFRLGELYLRDLTIRFEGDIEKVVEQQSMSDSFARRRPDGDRDRDRDRRPGSGRGPGRDYDSRPGRDARPERPAAPRPEAKPAKEITGEAPPASGPAVTPAREITEGAPPARGPEMTPAREIIEEAPPAGKAAAPVATPEPAIPPKPETTPVAPVVEEAKPPAPAAKVEPKSSEPPALPAKVEPKSSEPPATESYDEEDEL